MIQFSIPSITDTEKQYMNEAIQKGKLCGDGAYTKLASNWFCDHLGIERLLLTTSGTHALEMAALLIDLKAGDEVIVPSYTFVSTVNAFMLRGAKPIFVDIEPQTMNIDVQLIEQAITHKTKAIFPVHYAGVACDMDGVMEIAKKHDLKVVEDAAQGVGSHYKGTPLGTIGDFGCFSFHETKNYTMGEGGAVIIQDPAKFPDAEIIREKGTNRSQFMKGVVDKYSWHQIGSSYLPSDVLAAMLCGQLNRFDEIMTKRMDIWDTYHERFESLEMEGKIIRPFIPGYASHNAHMYYILLPTENQRNQVMNQLRAKGISAVFHYIPLHTSPMGLSLGYSQGQLPVTEEYSGRILRLPLYPDMTEQDLAYICDSVVEIMNEVQSC